MDQKRWKNMLSWIFMDFVFQYYHKAHKNIAYSIENSLRQPAAKFFPQKGANLKSKKAHCESFPLTFNHHCINCRNCFNHVLNYVCSFNCLRFKFLTINGKKILELLSKYIVQDNIKGPLTN